MKKSKPTSVPGKKPERLKLTGRWQSAVKQAMQKKRPKGGWPKIGNAFER